MSGLELCQRDCSWAESKVVDLYPYDAGTDNGISYMVPTAFTELCTPPPLHTALYHHHSHQPGKYISRKNDSGLRLTLHRPISRDIDISRPVHRMGGVLRFVSRFVVGIREPLFLPTIQLQQQNLSSNRPSTKPRRMLLMFLVNVVSELGDEPSRADVPHHGDVPRGPARPLLLPRGGAGAARAPLPHAGPARLPLLRRGGAAVSGHRGARGHAGC